VGNFNMHEGDDKSIQKFCRKTVWKRALRSLRVNEDNIEKDLF
jgi:hypothetical protein